MPSPTRLTLRARQLAPTLLWALLLVAAAASSVAQRTPAGGEPGGWRLAVSQAYQVRPGATDLTAYLDVFDATGRPVTEGLADSDLAANLGSAPLAVNALRRFEDTGEGVAYLFLVDVSRSLSGEQFAEIRGALSAWVEGLGAADRAALLAFGDTSRLVVDFSADADRLGEGIASLAPTEGKTLLHRALRDALEIGRRQDPDLPGRRVLVVLSDGRDEGSGLVVDDLLDDLRADPLPIYAIGYSRAAGAERERWLGVLHRLASNSGGAFFDADRTGFAASYAAIRRAIRRVWAADLGCAGCVPDGNRYRLQVFLSRGERVLTDGVDLRLLPAPRAAAAAAVEPAAAVAEVDDDVPPPAPVREAATTASRVPGWIWWLAALLLAAVALWAWLRRRRAVAADDGESEADEPAESERRPPADIAPPALRPSPAAREARRAAEAAAATAVTASPAPRSETSVDDRPAPLRVRLVVVRGSRRGRQYTLMLRDSAVVGSRSDCDLVLSEEPEFAPQQFELSRLEGEVYIDNLSAANPTYVAGLEIPHHRPLKRDELVGTGSTILRVVFD